MRPILRSTLLALVVSLHASHASGQQPAPATTGTGSLRVAVLQGNSQPVSGIQVSLAPLPSPSPTTPVLPETQEALLLYLQNPTVAPPVTVPSVPMSPSEARLKLATAIQHTSPQNTGISEVGGISSEPVLLQQVQPEYSDEARQNRVQGTIELLMVVKDDGTVAAAEVTRGIGYGLDQKATDAVKRWRFRPAMKDGKPVFVFVSVLINFSLSARSPLRTAVTDANGIAVFANLPAATFAISATQNEYIGVTSTTLAAGSQSAADLPLVLRPAASVTGRVRDSAGAPLAGIRIALGVHALQDGRSTFFPGREVVTDSQGEYRFTSIADGKYYVRVQTAGASAAPLYYPGTADFQQAATLAIQSGQAIVGIDFVPPR